MVIRARSPQRVSFDFLDAWMQTRMARARGGGCGIKNGERRERSRSGEVKFVQLGTRSRHSPFRLGISWIRQDTPRCIASSLRRVVHLPDGDADDTYGAKSSRFAVRRRIRVIELSGSPRDTNPPNEHAHYLSERVIKDHWIVRVLSSSYRHDDTTGVLMPERSAA